EGTCVPLVYRQPARPLTRTTTFIRPVCSSRLAAVEDRSPSAAVGGAAGPHRGSVASLPGRHGGLSGWFLSSGVPAVELLSLCARGARTRGGGVMTIAKIMVPLDGSDLAEAALETAIDILREHPATTLLLLRAAEAPRPSGGEPAVDKDRAVREAESYLNGVVAGL